MRVRRRRRQPGVQTSQHGGLATVCWPHLWRAGLRQAQVIRFTRLHVVRTLKSTHTHARTLFRPSSSSTSKYIITVFFPERGLGARGRFLRDFYEIIIITVSFTESYVVVERRVDGCYVVRCLSSRSGGIRRRASGPGGAKSKLSTRNPPVFF